MDALLIVNEVIDVMFRKKERVILYKLDIEKPYDQINWCFILKVLMGEGFGRKWIDWILWCIFTAFFSILVNGSLTGYFRSTREIRQRDPLSSHLFVLGIEVLSILIESHFRRLLTLNFL